MSFQELTDRIFVGDTLSALRRLPSSFVDLGITSPPYNKKEKNKGWLVNKVVYDKFCDRLPESDYQKNQIEVLDELFRISRSGGSFFYNHKIRWDRGTLLHPMSWLSQTKWTIKQEIVWDRKIAANIRGWRFWQVEERVYWLYKPIGEKKIGKELKSKHALLTSIWRISPEKNNNHPAPFPLALPARAILSILDKSKNKIVIDPYCGSGTTLVAAKILGHRFIGIDISDSYAKLSEDRIRNYRKECEIVEDERQLHRVNRTFAERKNGSSFTGRFKNRKFQQSFIPIVAQKESEQMVTIDGI